MQLCTTYVYCTVHFVWGETHAERELSSKRRGENVAAQAYKRAKDAAAEAWAGAAEHSWHHNQQSQSQPQSESQPQSQVTGEAGEGAADGSGQWPLFSELRVLGLRDTQCTKQGAQHFTGKRAVH